MNTLLPPSAILTTIHTSYHHTYHVATIHTPVTTLCTPDTTIQTQVTIIQAHSTIIQTHIYHHAHSCYHRVDTPVTIMNALLLPQISMVPL